MMPGAALANIFWTGEMPERLRGATWVELAAACPIGTVGYVLSLDKVRVDGGAGGAFTAQTFLAGTFQYRYQDTVTI